MKYNILITGAIGWPFSANFVRDQLKGLEGKHVDVYVDSFGGAVVDALDIRQQFIDHGDVTVHIFGMTASAATILAMGAKKVVMSKFAMLLVHQCSNWVDTWGSMNAEQLAQAIKNLTAVKDKLETVDHVIANVYAAKTGKSVEDCAAWMKKASWLTADKCKDMGLVDDICEEGTEMEDLTDELRAKIVACGFPVPGSEEKQEEKPMTLREQAQYIKNVLLNLFSPKKDVEEVTQNTDKKMKVKDYASINAALKVEEMEAAENGSVTLTAEQMKNLNDLLAEQNETIENLNKADGDGTTRTEGGEGNGDAMPGALASEMYKNLFEND